MVDEIQTGGGAAGGWWLHEQWDLPSPPDTVSFSKKFMLGGFYFHEDLFPQHPMRIQNTWLGDPVRMAMLETVVSVVEDDKLLLRTEKAGNRLLKGIEQLAESHADLLSNPRGNGTLCAFDLPSTEQREAFLKIARNQGLAILGCGEKAIRFRPALIFTEAHAEMACELIDTAVNKLRVHEPLKTHA